RVTGDTAMKTFARDDDRAEIVRRLRLVRADSVRRWGTMTPHQMICHCADACRMACGQVAPVDGSTVATRTVVKWIALYAPMPWPAGIQTVAEFDQRTAGTPPAALGADLATLAALLGHIGPRAAGEPWPR